MLLCTARDAPRLVLQTGVAQTGPMQFSASMGLTRISVHEPFGDVMPRSVCFALAL